MVIGNPDFEMFQSALRIGEFPKQSVYGRAAHPKGGLNDNEFAAWWHAFGAEKILQEITYLKSITAVTKDEAVIHALHSCHVLANPTSCQPRQKSM